MTQVQPRRIQQPPPLPQAMPAGGYGVPTAAVGHVPMLVTIASYGKAAIIVLLTIIVLEMFGGVTGFAPSQALGGFFGRVAGSEMEARQVAEEEYREKIATAEANVQRETMRLEAELQRTNAAYEAQLEWMSGAYQAAYERLNTVTAYAAEMEKEYLATVAQTQRAGQAGSNMVANFADIGCAFGLVAGDPNFARACGMGAQIREQNVREVERAVSGNAGQITAQVMAGLPDPQDLATQLQRVGMTAVPSPGQ